MKTVREIAAYALNLSEDQLRSAAEAEGIVPAGERDGEPTFNTDAELAIVASAARMFGEMIHIAGGRVEIKGGNQ